MKTKFLIFVPLVLLGSLLLTACSGRGASTTWPGMTATDSVAYLADGVQIYAVDLNTGKDVMTTVDGTAQAMRFPAKADTKKAFYAPPVLTTDGQLIVSSSGSIHELYSIDPQTFNQNWVFAEASDSFIGAVLATGDTIYAPNSDGTLYALDLKGHLLWKFHASDHALWAQPVSDGTTLYIASLDHSIYALNAASGAKIWSRQLDGSIANAPALGPDGSLYIGTFNRSLYALSGADGSVRWQKQLDGWAWSSPVLDGNVLYYGLAVDKAGGELQAADAQTGAVAWTFVAAGAVVGDPLVQADTIFIATEPGMVYAVNKSGGKSWEYNINEQLYTSPYAADNMILVATMNAGKLLFGLTPAGAVKWNYEPGK